MIGKKYLKVFTNAIQETLQYRVNFIFGRITNLVVLVSMYFLWTNVFVDPGMRFFGFSKPDIITYVLGASVVYSIVFVQSMNPIAFEIADGDLSNYLVKPISYFKYWFSRNNAQRVLLLVMAIFEVGVISFFIDRSLIVVQQDVGVLFVFAFAVILSIVAYQLLDFLMGISAFWLYKSFGPRWALQTTITLASGYIVPLDVLPPWLRIPLEITPFPYLVNFPLKVYLGLLDSQQLIVGFTVLIAWTVVLYGVYAMAWRRGLKTFEGAGR